MKAAITRVLQSEASIQMGDAKAGIHGTHSKKIHTIAYLLVPTVLGTVRDSAGTAKGRRGASGH
jgi:hypothetical protein